MLSKSTVVRNGRFSAPKLPSLRPQNRVAFFMAEFGPTPVRTLPQMARSVGAY
jgi:hypothetical protein